MLHKLLNDDSGFVVSAELMIIVTLAFTAAVVGAAAVRDAVVSELEDTAEAISSINQSYSFRSLAAGGDGTWDNNGTGIPGGPGAGTGKGGHHGGANGGAFQDGTDDCDCVGVAYAAVCGKTGSNGTDGT